MKISTTSKLDGVRSWSLQALETCPGSIAAPGVLVDACAGCYATTGEKKMQKPTILEIACAVFGFASLALFVFMCLAY